jgi:hypothetical protein
MMQDSSTARIGDLTMTLVTKENGVCTNPHRAISLDGWVVESVFTKE